MTIAAVVGILLGIALGVTAVLWYHSWSFPVLLGGIVLACLGGLWLSSVAIDKGIKDYIDYARKDKEDDCR